MEVFGWIMFLLVVIYTSFAGALAIMFGGPDLSPVKPAWFAVFLVAMAVVWFFVYVSCPFSVQLN